MYEDRKPMFTLFVEGTPAPQGSKTPVMRNGRVFLIEGKGKGNQRWKLWRKTVADAVLDNMKLEGLEETDNLVGVNLEFKIRRPSSKPKRVRAVGVRPDVDKLARSVLDSLTTSKKQESLLSDDSRVVELKCSKYYVEDNDDSPAGVHIEVYDLEDLRLWPKES